MQLYAGPVRVEYEQGALRYFTVGGCEVLRMLYVAVRDQDWSTVPGVISDEVIEQSGEGFRVRYQWEVDQGAIQMQWRITLQGQPDGSVSFDVSGTALGTFHKNRLGICVLHPIDGLAGQPCRVSHPDGSHTEQAFPQWISPYQPLRNIRSMQYQTREGGEFRLEFAGEVFETEDQRNWSDASYKTYGTPLDLPFPVQVRVGTEVRQQVTFQLLNAGSQPPLVKEKSISLELIGAPFAFPTLGIGMNAEGVEPNEAETHFLRSAGFAHLRADIDLTDPQWSLRLEEAISQGRRLQLPLELALFFGNHPAAEAFQLLKRFRLFTSSIQIVLLFEGATRLTTDRLLSQVVPIFRSAWPQMRLGGGTDANFAEFNRHAFDYTRVDFVTYSINPQVHASDDRTLVENLAAQADTVQSAHHRAKGKPVHVSPITLRPRFNAVATSENGLSLPPVDHRQRSDFAAGWTLGSLQYLGGAGAAAITYYETTGDRGICGTDGPFPVGQLLTYIGQFRPHYQYPIRSAQPLKVSALLLGHEGARSLLLANHTPVEQVVTLPEDFRPARLVGTGSGSDFGQSVFRASTLSLAPFAWLAVEGSFADSTVGHVAERKGFHQGKWLV